MIRRLVFLLVLLFATAITTNAQSSGVQTTTNDTARFRSGPGTSWRILATLTPGTPINIDARDGTNNFWVRGAIPDGQVGWLTSNAVTINPDQLNSLPIKTVDDPFDLSAPSGEAPAAAPDNSDAVEETTSNVAAPPPPVAAGLPPIRGFAYGGHVNDFNAVSIGWMQHAGMTWVKKQIRYYDGMPASDVSWRIAEAHNQGFRILLGVVGFPNELSNPGYADRYAAFVGELARLGADAIEVWNEPNIDREWPSGQISPATYTNFLAVAYNGIKSNNRNTLVVSGAPAPTGFFGGCSVVGCDDIHFISGMRDAGAAQYMDCVGVHYNEGILPPTARSGDPRGNSGYYTRYFLPMLEVYSNAFGGRVPLCFTELGYLTPEGFGPLPGGFAWAENVTVAQQAAWLDQAVSLARNSGRVRLMIIWNVDYKDYGADPVGGYAMIRPDLSCPACDALAN